MSMQTICGLFKVPTRNFNKLFSIVKIQPNIRDNKIFHFGLCRPFCQHWFYVGLCSDIRRGVGGVRHVGHLEHHDPVHGAGLGGLQGDPGPAGQTEGRCGEKCGHHPVAPGTSSGSPALAGLEQVRHIT